MRRKDALRKISHSNFLKSVEGVACRKDENVLDEAPDAYKPIGKVMKLQKDLVTRVNELRPLVNIRG